MNEKIKAFASQISTMTEQERADIAARMPVLTIAGHVISARNTVLLSMQSTEPHTIIGGFRQWIEAGRCVRKGEKAAYILRPVIRKGKEGKEDESNADKDSEDGARFFVSVPMFDVAQTEELREVTAETQ